MQIFKNISQLATLKDAHKKDGRNLSPEDLCIIKDGAVVFDEENILWVGKSENIPKEFSDITHRNLSGYTVTPEIVDAHTHLIFAGDRSEEYSMRLNGADYQEIANTGGGILNTVNGTNNSSVEDLKRAACERIERIYGYGVGTIEIKSGYGLNMEKEREISKLIDQLKSKYSPKIQIKNTYMAAHAVPKNFAKSHDYIMEVVIPLMEELVAEKVIDAVDIFHEDGYFDKEDVETFFNKANELNIPVKIHADEFNDNKGAVIACKYDALSADHLLNTGCDGIKELARGNTVAVLLPGTGFFLGKAQADGRALLDAGAKVAIASDYNPGSCHCDNVLLLASLAAPQYKMNLCELWTAITMNAAHALGLIHQGAIVEGLRPRFSIFKTNTIDKITYSWGQNFVSC